MAEEPREEAHQGSLLVHLRRCRNRQLDPVRRFAITLRLANGPPSEPRHQLGRGRAVQCMTHRCRFPQSVRRTLRQSRLVAALSEPIAEPRGSKRFALFSHQEGHLILGMQFQFDD